MNIRLILPLSTLIFITACEQKQQFRGSQEKQYIPPPPTPTTENATGTTVQNENTTTTVQTEKEQNTNNNEKESDHNQQQSDTTQPSHNPSEENQLPSQATETENNASSSSSSLTPICIQGAAKTIDVSVPKHQDTAAAERNRYGGTMPVSDIQESSVVELKLSEIKGDYLPVKTFSLDDIAFIAKASYPKNNLIQGHSRERKITIPSDAFLIYDGNNPNYAEGAVDSDATTFYIYNQKEVKIPGQTSYSLRQVYQMGVPLIPHHRIQIKELIDKGYAENNILRFKIFHVAHGFGHVSLTFELQPCKN